MEYLQVSYSSLNTFDSCARKFEFRKLYPRKKIWEEAFAAAVGQALHAGYQTWLVTQDSEKAIWNFLKMYPHELSFSENNDFRSPEAALATLEEMIQSVALADYELAYIVNAAGETVPAIEVPFAIRLNGITLPDGRGVEYTGYIDAIMRNIVTGTFRTMDIKTHRRYLRDATAKYKYDSQQIPYGIVVDHVAGQNVESFDVLYLDCFVDLLEPRVQQYQFLKHREDLEEWMLDIILKMQQMQKYATLNHFPRTQGGCLSFNRPCSYLDVCETRDKDSIIEWFLMGNEPAVEPPMVPWIRAEIDVFEGVAA